MTLGWSLDKCEYLADRYYEEDRRELKGGLPDGSEDEGVEEGEESQEGRD